MLDLTLLSLQARKVRGAAVDARGGSCLEARDLESGAFELLGQMSRCGFSSPASGETHLGADVNPTAKEGAGRDYDAARAEASPLERLDSENTILVVQKQSRDGPLDRRER